jgi:hypothetical protein
MPDTPRTVHRSRRRARLTSGALDPADFPPEVQRRGSRHHLSVKIVSDTWPPVPPIELAAYCSCHEWLAHPVTDRADAEAQHAIHRRELAALAVPSPPPPPEPDDGTACPAA